MLVCLVPALLASVLLIFSDFRERSKLLNSQALTLARATISAVDRELQRMQSNLVVLATSPHLERGELALFREQVAKVQQATGAINFVLTQPSGQMVVNLLSAPDAKLPMHGNPKLIESVVVTGRPQISDLFVANFSAQPVIVVAVPVFRGAELVYVLTGGFSPKSLGQILLDQNYPTGWIGALVDGRRLIVARTHQANRFIGSKTPVAATLDLEMEGSVEARTLEGIDVTTSFTQSKTTGWTVILGVPKSQLLAPLWRYVAVAAGLVAVLLMAGVGAAAWIGGHIAKTVTDLNAPAAALASGEPLVIPKLYFSEAEQLAGALLTSGEILRQARTDLVAGEQRLRGILQSAMDGIITVDEEQRVVLFNAAAVAMFGWGVEEAMGRPLTQFIPSRFAAAHSEHMKRFALGGTSRRRMGLQGEILGLRKNGEEFPIEASISQIEEGERRFFTVILRDVSEQLASRRALERSNVDLRHFAFVASHDLKGPLRTISGFVNLLERGYSSQLGPKGMELLGRTGKAAHRLEQMTDGLLLIAQVEGKAAMLVPLDCNVLVREALMLLQAPIHDAGASIEVDPLPTVMGVTGQLEHVFLNLLANAIKFRSDKPLVIKIRANREGDTWTISISDNGLGIDTAHQDMIFQVFGRLHGAQKYEGVGIGLALCRRIMERHGGKVWVESSEGEGSTFRLSLAAA